MRQVIDRYEVRGTAGRGAMGTVYDAWDARLARRVAIKTLNLAAADDCDLTEKLCRFHREANIVAILDHPNIVKIFDFGETLDEAYLVMEFIDGKSIKEVMSSGQGFSLQQTKSVMEDVLSGLHYSHTHGVVHRDVKPANIMMTTDRRIKITDFGVAKLEDSSVTQTGTIIGTPAYMSPEQCLGSDIDFSTDIYSAGVMLYELVTGRRAFEGDITSIIYKILNTTLERPSLAAVGVPRALDMVISRAMARERADRYSTALSFQEAMLAAFSDDTVVVTMRAPQLVVSPKPAEFNGVSPARPDLSCIPAYVEPPKETRIAPVSSNRLGFYLLGFIALMLMMTGVLYFYPSEPGLSTANGPSSILPLVAPAMGQSNPPNRQMVPFSQPPLPASIRMPIIAGHLPHPVLPRPRYRN